MTETGALVVALPAKSRATAVRMCPPEDVVVVSHGTEYGADVASAPTGCPSTKKRTPATPTSSDAVAAIVVVPKTVAPDAGAVIATLGGALSGGGGLALNATSCMIQNPAPLSGAVAE